MKKYSGANVAQDWQGLTVHRPGFFYLPGMLKNSDAWFYARGLKRWLQQYCENTRPDLLDAHFIWPDGVGVALLAKELGIPYTITLRGKIYECLKVPSQAHQCAEALKGAAAVISVSSRMADEALRLGAPKDRLHVISNGVNLEHFAPRDKQECRAQLGLPADRRLIVTVAHLGHRKGHHEMIAALAGLPEDVQLVIVGGAAQGGSAEQLTGIARDNGVEDRLILPGPQPYARIPLYFSAADVSVLASYREGCPNAVLEALASGTPVVATDVGAVPDILPESVGRIVPPEQVEPLREAVADVLEKSWITEQVIADSGVRSWEQVGEEVQKVFQNLLI
ncbi:glycosyltransferase [Malonomonas rubra]|uniref:glycosyltransferase n=1 Tax=Malonomonas rubra TaxID=57040 RepID=UPI001FC9ED85|nr:glycosyltransferase [Malonomonas rubra]